MTPLLGLNEWERRRAMLSHDTLKNQFCPAISKLRNILDGKVDDPEYTRVFLDELPYKLSVIDREIDWLIKHATELLSPKQLFDIHPLVSVDSDTKEWLPIVAYELWAARTDLEVNLRMATDLLGSVRVAATKLAKHAVGKSSVSDVLAANSMANRVQALSTHIANMRVLVPVEMGAK